MISTRQVAKRLGLSAMALSRYIAQRKIPEPKKVMLAGMKIYNWTEEEIQHVRKLLPKIANGRKTRYKKQKNKLQAKKPVPKKK